jgi:hypothetical protein
VAPEKAFSATDEREQVFVDLILGGRAHPVQRALVDLELRAADDLENCMAAAPIGTIWSSSTPAARI